MSDNMRIILLGPPGAGKGTQADYICEQLNIPKISTGDMMRAAMAKGDEFGNQIKQVVNAGKLVADDIIVRILIARISEADCRNGFLLDGFPRTITQAEALQQAGVHIDFIIQLNVPNEEIVKRLSGRRVHLDSGRTYHVIFNPPATPDLDDITGEPLIQRPDDSEATVRHRLEVYKQQTEPLVAWYRQRSAAIGTRYEPIDGSKSVTEVKQEILNILLPKRTASRM